MKKLIAIILAMLMFLSLVACDIGTSSDDLKDGEDQHSQKESSSAAKDEEKDPPLEESSSSTENEEKDPPHEESSSVTEDEEKDPPQEESSSATEDEEKDPPQDEPDNSDTDKKDEITFTELVVVDNDDCMIKVTGIDPDNFWGYTLKIQLENKSADKTYMFSVLTAHINGIECDPFFATEVNAGKKANDNIHFTSTTLEENGITDYTDIELTFSVYDSDDLFADDIVQETVHIYPYGEDKAVQFVRPSKESDIVLVDNKDVTVIITDFEDDDIWGYTANLFLINKTDKNLMFSVNDSSINGCMTDPFWATSVNSGKCKFSSMSWSDTTLEENGITDYTDIEITLRVYDSDDLFADDIVQETVHIYPYGEDKAVQFVRPSKESDIVLVDNKDVTVIITGFENDDIWGYTANLFLINKTDKNLMFSVNDASINGYMADPFFATSVNSGKCKFSSMSWSDTTLEENGITDVQEIEFKLRVYIDDDWFADDLVDEIITITP